MECECDNCKSKKEVRNVSDDTTKYTYLCKQCIMKVL